MHARDSHGTDEVKQLRSRLGRASSRAGVRSPESAAMQLPVDGFRDVGFFDRFPAFSENSDIY